MSAESELMGKDPVRQGLPKRLMIMTTLVIFYGNITFGCAFSVFGPSLTDFKKKFDTETSTISIIFTVQTGCYMVGALVCTFIYAIINRQFVVGLLFAGITASMMVAPHVPSLTTFYILGGFLGFCMGCYDTAQVVWIMEMWQGKSAPYIQAQHFCFSIGAIITPSLMAPFLVEEDDDEDATTTTTSTSTTGAPEEENKRLFVPFTIIGCMCAVTMIGQFLLFVFMRYRPPPPEEKDVARETKTAEVRSGNVIQRLWPGWPIARLVILSMLTVGFNQGMEMVTGQFFPTFGQKSDLKLSEADSAYTMTGQTTAFAVGRAIGIPLVFWVAPEYLFFADLAITLLGNVVMVAWGYRNLTALWIAGILYGLGFASQMPAFCAYMERYLNFSNTMGALLIVSGSTVGSLYPLVVGAYIDDHPLVFTYPIFFSCGIMICSVTTAYWITTLRKTKKAS